MKNGLPFFLRAISGVMIFIALAGISIQNVSAHQRQLLTIGDKDYLFVVGSQNEPIFVDDKSGVDLFVYIPNSTDPMNSRASGVMPVEGLEQTLKVEISAGDKKKVFDLRPAFRDPGHFNAPFYPTIQTTYNYRFFGNINNMPVDLTFSCSPAGEAALMDNSIVRISPGVTRKSIVGGFGCPESRSDAGFPEPYISNNEIKKSLTQIQSEALGGIAAGLMGIAIAIVAIVLNRKKRQ